MKVVAALVFILLIGATPSYAQELLYREKTDLATSSEKGEISIDIANTTLRLDETYSIRYKFHATKGSFAVYNWQFIPLLSPPGQLVIYDKNKKYIGDLLGFRGGSRRTPGRDDWTILSEDSFIGKSLSLKAGFVPNTKYEASGGGLLPGTYYIQLVLYKAFLSPNPFLISGAPVSFIAALDRSELCRSNVIRIRIVGQ